MSGTVLHLGLGAFHRAHQAALTDAANRAAGSDWRIEAVAMRNPALADTLNAQQGRYGLIIQHPEGPELQPISALKTCRALPRVPQAIIDRFALPDVHVITLTVTEKGYAAGPDGLPLWQDPVLQHDEANPESPKGTLGLLAAGLDARRRAGGKGLTLLCCDNLPDNGQFLSRLLITYLQRSKPDLAQWTSEACRFPSSMVDRITPAASEETYALAQRLLGRHDPGAIETEPFCQWVIEDTFAGPRPPWEAAGVHIVQDVTPFEAAKLRMLNGAHSLAAYAGALLGLEAIRDVMAHPPLATALHRHMSTAAESLDPISGFSYAEYANDLLTRFGNPAIRHLCLQIAMDGSQKMPQRIFDTALARAARGLDLQSCALATAIWLRFLDGRAENGSPLPLNDPLSDPLRAAVRHAKGDATVLVAAAGKLLGGNTQSLWQIPNWQSAVATALHRIRAEGLERVLAEY